MRTLDEMVNTLPLGGQWFLYSTTNGDPDKNYRATYEEKFGGWVTALATYGKTPQIAMDNLLKEMGR